MTDLRSHTDASLGIRNNNPGNLRDTGLSWQGAVGSNKGFVVFSSAEYGVRAMAKDLSSKINRGLNTIERYISVYAPPSENDTEAYISTVSSRSGIGRNTTLTADSNTLAKLIKAQIFVENGNDSRYITDSIISNGIALTGKIAPSIPIIGIIIAAIIIIAILK